MSSNGTETVKTAAIPLWTVRIRKKTEHNPPRLVIYGEAGVGKTTLASSMPAPVLLDFNKGADQLKIDKIPGPKTWPETRTLLAEIAKDPSGYKTLVIDTMEEVEEIMTVYRLAEDGRKSLDDKEYGWGGGYNALRDEWRLLLNDLDAIRERGVMVCLLGHAIVREAIDPQLGAYNSFTVGLQKKTYAATKKWCDAVLFAAFDASRMKDEKRNVVSGRRVLLTTKGSGYEAKNRYSLPDKIDLGWKSLSEGIEAHLAGVKDVRDRILTLAKGTDFVEKANGFIAEAGEDVRRLLQIENALKEKLSEEK